MKLRHVTDSATVLVFAAIFVVGDVQTPAAEPRGAHAGGGRSDASAAVHGTGTIEPQQVIDASALVEGRVVQFGEDRESKGKPLDYGSRVEKGQVLAILDDSLYKTRLDEQQAGLRVAQAKLELAKAKLESAVGESQRLQAMAKSAAVSQAEVDSAKSNERIAKAGLDIAAAELARQNAVVREAQINLDRTKITSPIDGIIIDRRVNIGQTVVASLNAPSLFLIAADLKKLEVWTSVNETDIGRIKVGQPAEFTVAALPDDVFKGKVTQVRLNAQVTQNVVVYTVVVSFENADGKLLPYMTANVQFDVGQ
jgi:HlyD family secretion protein